MKLILIAAASQNGVLAVNGKIPWHLPRDVTHFRARTDGHWLLLGRITFEQMTGWFQPGHVPMVLTAGKDYPVPGGWAVTSMPEALDLAASHDARELLVCGGGQVYVAALPFADEVILTTVEINLPGSDVTRFPALLPGQWNVVETTSYPPDSSNNLPMTIRHLRRSPKAAHSPKVI